MNRIYKVIWSKVRNAYVVVSELAKNHGKEKCEVHSSHGSRLGAALLLSLLLGGSLVAGGVPAEAAAVNAGTTGNSSTSAKNNNTLAVGDNTTANGAGALAVGGGTAANGLRAIAIAGGQAKSDYTISIGENSVAGGGYSYTAAGSTTNTLNGIATKAIAIGSSTSALGVDDVVIGANQTARVPDSAYYEEDANGQQHIAVGGRVLVGHDNVATGRAGNSVIVGSNNKSNSVHGIAIGENSQVGMPENTKDSSGNTLNYENTMAIGTNTRAYASNAIAIGNNAVAGNSDPNQTAYNRNGQGAVALGENATSTAYYTVAISGNAKATNAFAVAIGEESNATGRNTLAMGYQAKATADSTIANGYGATASATNAVATGLSAAASGKNSVALGANSTASSSGGVALGSSSTSTRAAATSSSGWNGQDSTWSSWAKTKDTSLATSSGVWNSTSGVVSIGTDGADGSTITRQLTGVAAGTKDTDAVNMAQWKNTVLATVGDDKSEGLTKTYGTDGAARNVTKVLNESLTITGAGDTARSDAAATTTKTLKKTELTSQANIGTVVSDNQIAIRLAKNLQGLETASLSNSTSGNSTKVSGDGITITPTSGSTVSLTQNGLDNGGKQITNVASGGDTGTNGANIDDVTRISQKNIQVKGGSNITVTDSTVNGVRTSSVALNNNVNLSADGSLAFGSTTDNTYVDKTGVTTHVANTDGTKVDATLSGAGLHVIGKASDGTTSNQVVTDESGMVVGYETGDKANTLFDTAVGSGKQKTSISTKGVKVEGTTNLDTNGQTSSTSRKINTTLSEEGVNINQSQTLLQERGLTVGKDAEKTTAGQATVYRTGLNVVGSAVNDTADKTATVTANGLTANGDATGDKIATVTAEGMTVQADADKKQTATYNVSGVTLSDKTSGTKTNTVSVDGMTIQNGTSGTALTTTNLQLGMTNGTGGINLGNQAGGGANTAEGNYLTGLSNTAWDAKNIASGRAATEDQLKAVSDSISAAAKPTLVTVEGGTAAGTTDYAGNNLKLKATTADGQTTYDLKLADKVTLGSGNQAVTLDGTSGKITAGTDTTRQVVFDGVAATARVGADISLDGAAGKAHIGGTTIGRLSAGELTYKDKDGNIVTGTTVPAGSYATGLSNTSWNVENPNYVTGRAATEDELVTVSKAVTTKTFGLTDDAGTAVTKTLDNTIQVKGDDKAISTSVDNGALKVSLKDDITIGEKGADGKDGVDGKIGVNGKDGSAVVINGKDGSIGLNGKDGANGLTIKGENGSVGVDGTDGHDGKDGMTRIVYEDHNQVTHEVATLDDGLKFKGDDDTVIAKKLNTQLDITGGADKSKLTSKDNIGVNSTDDGKLKIQLAKNLDLDADGSVTTGNTVVNNSGLTITNNGNTVSLTDGGLDNGGNRITNVANGTDATDAVNYSQLSEVKTLAGKHTVVTVEGGTAAGTDTYAGTSLKLKATTTDGQTTYDLKLGDNLSIGGKDGADGKDGHIGVNGKDGVSGVGIDGKDGISIKGQDGKDGVTIKGIDGVDGVNGAEGHIGLNGKDGMTDIWTKPGEPGLNGKDGETMTRIVYKDPQGHEHQGATLDDGLKFGGDSGTAAAVKLNKQLNVTGGETDNSKLAAGNNLGVVSSQDGDNGKLEIKLAKDLTGLDSVTTGNTVVNNSGITISSGTTKSVKLGNQAGGGANAAEGNYLTGLDNTAWDAKNIASGRAATEDQLKAVADAIGTDVSGKTFGLSDDTNATVSKTLGSTIQVKGDGKAISTTVDGDALKISLNDNITIGGKDGTNGKDGHIGVDGKDGKDGADGYNGKDAVSIDGKDGNEGHIGLNGKDGKDGERGQDGKNAYSDISTHFGPASLNDAVNVTMTDGSVKMTRLKYEDQNGNTHEVATMDDGQVYGGDTGTAFKRYLNQQANVKGGITDESKLTADDNIGVVSDGTDTLKVRLAKELKGLTSVTTGNTVVNNSGITITNGTKSVSLTDSGLNNGGNKITNVANGTDATDAVNYSQLSEVKTLAGKHTVVTVEGGTEAGTDTYAGSSLKLKATTTDGQTTYDLKLGDNLSIGGKDGADGKDGHIGVNGKDGVSGVGIDGKNGISIKGQNGKDGVTIKGIDGVDGVNGAEGHIGLNGKDGMTDIWTKPGEPGLNGKDGETMTRIVYKDPQGQEHQGATLDDGLKFGGDSGTAAAVKLNKQLNVTGGETDSSKLAAGNNLGVVSSQDGDNGKLEIKLAKDLTGLDSVTTGNTVVNNSGITISSGTTKSVKLGNQAGGGANAATGNYLTGLNNTAWDAKNIASGRAATEDQLKAVADAIGSDVSGKTFGLTDDAGTAVTKTVGNTIQVKGDDKAISTTVDGDALKISLNDNITIGGKDGANGKDGHIGVDGKDGKDGADGYNGKDAVSIDGKDGNEGHIGLNGKDGKDGERGADGKNAYSDISTHFGPASLNDAVNVTMADGTTKMTRLKYEDQNGNTHEVATMDDGQVYGGDTGTAFKRYLNQQANVKGGITDADKLTTDDNIGVVSDGTDTLKVRLAKELKGLDSVTTGNTVVNNDGITINNKVSLTDSGLDNGGNRITNVATGVVNHDASDNTNAANIGDVKSLASSMVTVSGGKNTNVTATTGTDGTKNYQVNLDDTVLLGSVESGEYIRLTGSESRIQVGPNLSLDGTVGEAYVGGVNIGKVTADNTLTYKDKNGNYLAPGIAAGSYVRNLDNTTWDMKNPLYLSGRAATEDQLFVVSEAVEKAAEEAGKHTKVTADGQAPTDTTYVGNNLKVNVTTTADGQATYDLKLGDNLSIGGEDGKDGSLVVKGADGSSVVINGKEGSVKTGDTTINKDGVETNQITIKDSSISISKDGIDAGSKQVTNVASGTNGKAWDATTQGYEANWNNAANIGDVKQIAGSAAESVKAKSGKNITVAADNSVNLNDQITLGDETNKAQQVTIDGKGATIMAGSDTNQVKLDGSKGRIIAGGATLGKQENTSGDGNPASGSYLNGLDNKTWDASHIQTGRAATEDQLKVVDDKLTKGRVFQGDDGKDNAVTVGLGDTMKLTGGADAANLTNGNIGVVRNSDGDGLEIKLAKDIKGLDSVTTGNTTINNSGVTIKSSDSAKGGDIKLATGEVSMGGSQIHDVAPGTSGTDAVNVNQLSSAMGNVERNFSKLDARVNRAGANAAALAALHPLDFDPDDKLDVAAGTGHYNGANAVAIGAFYRPNEDTMISLGGSMGGGENMINAGVTFKLGQHNHVSNTRVAMAKEIKALKALVDQQNGEMQQMKQLMNQLAGKTALSVDTSALFPDIPQNHWAYEYVTKLAHTGIVEGYPDGEFKGDRMMTRYEFAAMLYRAIMNGAASNPDLNKDGTLDKLTKEFEPELKYIRIDTIAKDHNGNPTIERVRVIKQR